MKAKYKHQFENDIYSVSLEAVTKGDYKSETVWESLGKSVIIRSFKEVSIRRQYYICNCLRKDNYDQLMEAIAASQNQSERSSDMHTALTGAAHYQSDITLAVVDLKGLSSKLIYADDAEEFQVRAHMGKGLCLQAQGTHIAFCAGPMTACFLDLAALLLKVNLGLEKRPE